MTRTLDRNIVRIFETVYLRGFSQSLQRFLDGRTKTQGVSGATNRHLIEIPLFESLSWAYAIVEGLGGSDWIKSHPDRKFLEAIRLAGNKAKHNLQHVVDEHDAMMVPPGMNPMFMGVEGNWKWRRSLGVSGQEHSDYSAEIGGQPIYESLRRLESIIAKGISQEFSADAKT